MRLVSRNKFKPSSNFPTDRSKAVLLLWIFFNFVFVFVILSCLCVAAPSVCDVFLCICHFPIRCPGSGVVFDGIDS